MANGTTAGLMTEKDQKQQKTMLILTGESFVPDHEKNHEYTSKDEKRSQNRGRLGIHKKSLKI